MCLEGVWDNDFLAGLGDVHLLAGAGEEHRFNGDVGLLLGNPCVFFVTDGTGDGDFSLVFAGDWFITELFLGPFTFGLLLPFDDKLDLLLLPDKVTFGWVGNFLGLGPGETLRMRTGERGLWTPWYELEATECFLGDFMELGKVWDRRGVLALRGVVGCLCPVPWDIRWPV